MPLQNLRRPRLPTQPHTDWVARFAPNTSLTSPRLSFPASPLSILALEPTELRKLFNGLWVAATQLHEDPLLQGTLLVFANCSRDRVKLLHRDGTGVWILLTKRLEKGRFCRLAAIGSKLALTSSELDSLLSGSNPKPK